jgi:phospholipase C
MSEGLSRRRLLAAAAATTGATVAGSLLPPSVQAALANPPRQGGIRAIKHVVLLMQENRSFDHYFGTLRGVRGFGDRNAISTRSGDPVFRQSGVLPFSIREAAAAKHENLEYVASLDHSWAGGHQSMAQGWHDGWIDAKGAATMAYYDRKDLPLHYELADTFTICDAYHCSVPSSTSPNRNYFVSGYTGYEPDGVKRAISNDSYDEDNHSGYSWTTYAERLEAAGKSWRVYQEWDNYQDNNLEFFVRFKQIARKALADLGFKSLDRFYAAVFAADSAGRRTLLDGLAAGLQNLDPAERRLYERALLRVDPGTLAAAFRSDVEHGTLPQVSYIVPSAADSEHPSASSPAASATITYQILDALASNPEIWAQTAVFITYDENDGYFDHVPPPLPGPEHADEYAGDLPIGLGIRVPMLVISPWSVGGYVCSQTFDHTSMTRFAETWLGVREPNISAWRRTVSGDLTSAFDFGRAQRRPGITTPGPVGPFTGRWLPTPPADQKAPAQEPGARRARPLPYQPDASVRLDGARLRLSMTNAGAESAHLTLYPYAGEFAVPKHFDVKAAATDTVPVTGNAYRLTLVGPNGFRREFAGAVGGSADVSSRVDREGEAVEIRLTNHGRKPLTFHVTPVAYGGSARRVTVRGGESETVEWRADRSHGWYDVTIAVAEEAGFHRRLAGHLENGHESITG